MNFSAKRTLLLFGVAAGLIPGLALLYGTDPPQEEPRMVDLNVVGLDSHGQPVNDLSKDEFKVTDNGKPETIAFFRHRDSTLSAVPKLGPNEFSNRGGSNVPHATLVLFDLLNERFGTRAYSANQLIHDLGSLESADYVYLYCVTLDGKLYPVHPLPGPETPVPPPGAAPWTRGIKPLMDQAMKVLSGVRPVDDYDITYRVEMTYRVLDGVASLLARVPGRKSLVWVTDSVPIELGPRRSDTGDFVDFTPLLRQMSEAYDRSGVSIYPVRQVMMGSPDSMSGGRTSGVGSIDTLDMFAQMTGGRPDAGKDISAALRQAVIDMRTSYQVGYFPAPSNWDNKLHKLRVTCTRKGVRLQTKTNYYAWEDAPGARSDQAIASAVGTAYDAAEIGVRASLTPDPNGHGVHLDAHIDAHDIALVHEGDKYDGELRVAMVGYGQGSDARRGPVTPLEIHLNAQDRDKALQQGIGYTQDIALPAEMRLLRLIVFDRGSNAIGSLTIPISHPGQ